MLSFKVPLTVDSGSILDDNNSLEFPLEIFEINTRESFVLKCDVLFIEIQRCCRWAHSWNIRWPCWLLFCYMLKCWESARYQLLSMLITRFFDIFGTAEHRTFLNRSNISTNNSNNSQPHCKLKVRWNRFRHMTPYNLILLHCEQWTPSTDRIKLQMVSVDCNQRGVWCVPIDAGLKLFFFSHETSIKMNDWTWNVFVFMFRLLLYPFFGCRLSELRCQPKSQISFIVSVFTRIEGHHCW